MSTPMRMFILSLVVCCALPLYSRVAAQNSQQCVTSYDSTTDYFPVKSIVEFAKDFTLTYNLSYKVLTNVAEQTQYVLYQCGTPAPSSNLFPNTTLFFSVPVNKVWTLDTTSVTFLDMLGLRNRISIVSTEIDITSPCVLQSYQSGAIRDIETYNATTLLISNEDVAFGGYEYLPKMVFTDSELDPGIKNRPEWLKYYAAFFNLEDVANTLTNQIFDKINCFTQAPSSKNLVIGFASYSSYGGDSWTLSSATYKQQLVQSAGATYATPGYFNTSTAFLQASSNIDILIDETYFGSAPNFTTALGSYGVSPQNSGSYKWINNFFREDKLVTPAYGFDWLDAGDVMDDAALAEMLNIVGNSKFASYNRVWFRNLTAGEQPNIISASMCTGSSSLVDYAPACPIVPNTSSQIRSLGTFWICLGLVAALAI